MPITSFEHSGPPIGAEELDKLEEYLDAELPPGYREFLRHTNGGRPTPEDCFVSCGDNKDGSMINIFYAVSHERKSFTIARNYDAWEGRIPRDLLPIAGDAGDNQVCIGIRGKRYGKVFFWVLDLESEEGRPPGYSNVRLVAEEMDSFLDSFHDDRNPRDGRQ